MISGNKFYISIRKLFFRAWRPAVLVLSLTLIAYLLYFRHLGKLLPGYSTAELSAYLSSANWHTIINNPVNAPWTVPVWFLTAVTHHGLLMTRVVSACYGTLAAIAFFAVIRPRYQFRVAFLGTVLFATSAGFLHAARLGTPQILQMGVLALLAVALWYKRSHHRKPIGYVVLALCALLWYVPGMMWFELLGCAIVWRGLQGQLNRTPRLHVAGTIAIFLVVLAPLIVAGIRNPHVLLAATGLPSSIDVLSHIPNNLLHAALAIGIRSNGNPLLWVGHMPLLNAVELALGAIGAYFYLYRGRSLRMLFLVVSVCLSLLLISFGGSVGFASLVPLLYLFIIHGLDHLLSRWLVVFPRNPIARFTGVGIICAMLFFSVLYQVRSYFVAWPHSTPVHQTFNLPPS